MGNKRSHGVYFFLALDPGVLLSRDRSPHRANPKKTTKDITTAMNIQIDPAQLESAINTQITKAIEQALGGYGVQSAIAEKLTSDIATGAVGKALDAAIKSIDTEHLTNTLAEGIQRAMTRSVISLLHDGMADTLLSMRKLESYSSGYKEERARIIAQLQN